MRTLDIFCGGGLSSAGAQAAGAQIAGGVDMWDVATATFQDNFPSATVRTSRLEEIAPHQLRDDIGDIELLLASPECTNHTCAKGSAPRSEESRATAMQTLRFARAFLPRWLVMENVVHMRPWSRYAELKLELEKLGYNLKEIVLDAEDFGVPQRRKRLFVVGDRKAQPFTPNPPPRRISRDARSILETGDSWPTTPLFRVGRATGTLERAQRAVDALGKDSPFLIVYYGSDGSGGWQRLDRPLRTITTVDRFALVQPTPQGATMRMLQVPELSRGMGLPRHFRLRHGTRRSRIQLLGNGVCPPVMKAVVQALCS